MKKIFIIVGLLIVLMAAGFFVWQKYFRSGLANTGKGGTFAKKIYNRTNNEEHVHEETTLELTHKPKL